MQLLVIIKLVNPHMIHYSNYYFPYKVRIYHSTTDLTAYEIYHPTQKKDLIVSNVLKKKFEITDFRDLRPGRGKGGNCPRSLFIGGARLCFRPPSPTHTFRAKIYEKTELLLWKQKQILSR